MLHADALTTDSLTRNWTLTQRRHGHRHSTDDLVTGWYAIECAPDPERILDLGSGVGSVGLLALWRAPRATLTAIEAQEVSMQLLRRNVDDNGLGARVRAILGDLRNVRPAGQSFDLVTGSPPYFRPDQGIVPADSQKAHARFELRGDVRDYCSAARAAMAAHALFVFCFPSIQRERAERAWSEAGLALVRSREVLPRRGRPALFTLFACRREDVRTQLPHEPVAEPPHAVRDETGEETREHAALRASFGLPVTKPESLPAR